MTARSTPGPWVAGAPGAPGVTWKVRASNGRVFIVGDALYHPENEANARLIAASPDLLAALKAIVRLHPEEKAPPAGFGTRCGSCLERWPCRSSEAARAAIAKAEGGK